MAAGASREHSHGRVPAFIRILMSCDLRKCRTGKLRWQKLRHVCTRARGLLTIGPISGARMAETASRVYTRKRLSAKVRNLIGCQLGEVYDGRPLCPKSCRVCTHAKDFLTGVRKELRPPPGKGARCRAESPRRSGGRGLPGGQRPSPAGETCTLAKTRLCRVIISPSLASGPSRERERDAPRLARGEGTPSRPPRPGPPPRSTLRRRKPVS